MPYETIDEKIERLAVTLRGQMLEERARRAEAFADRMNKWIGTVLGIVTLLLIVFAVLGYKGYSDIQQNRERVQKLADEVSEKAAKVDAFSKQAEQTMAKWQQQSINTTNLQSNVELLVGTDPIVLKVPIAVAVDTVSTLEGKNFGTAPGHLYVLLQQDFTSDSKPLEIERSSIQKWSDKSISFILSHSDDLALVYAARESEKRLPFQGLNIMPFISFAVATSEGKTSGWSQVTGFLNKDLNQSPVFSIQGSPPRQNNP